MLKANAGRPRLQALEASASEPHLLGVRQNSFCEMLECSSTSVFKKLAAVSRRCSVVSKSKIRSGTGCRQIVLVTQGHLRTTVSQSLAQYNRPSSGLGAPATGRFQGLSSPGGSDLSNVSEAGATPTCGLAMVLPEDAPALT